jgi:N-acetylmuramoyl-L-alanine amidase
MGKKILLLFWISLSFMLAATAADKKFTLVIDAGHGGHDAGALGAFSKEKDINLNVALAFGRYVERNCRDVRVIYTRKTDEFIPLHERANIANKSKADLFVSVHTNALPGGKISRGLETYTLGMHRAGDNLDVAKRENSVILVEKDYKQHYEGFDPRSSESYIMFEFMQDKNMTKSVELAKLVQSNTCSVADRQNKGVKQAGFLVLRETSMPSCLVELGFITTPDEEQFLNSQEGVDEMGRGIYQAFVAYLQKYDHNFTVPFEAVDNKSSDEVDVPSVVPQNKVEQTVVKVRKAPEPIIETKPDAKPVQAAKADAKSARTESNDADSDEPVFKVQVLTSSRKLTSESAQLKGLDDVDCYEEGGLFKYTKGSTTNYAEIVKVRKDLLDKFPEAFIIAFKGGSRTDVVQAIKDYKRNKYKK